MNHKTLHTLIALTLLALTTACENISEMPPRQATSANYKTYQEPTPEVITSDEKDYVRFLQDEYKQNTTFTTHE